MTSIHSNDGDLCARAYKEKYLLFGAGRDSPLRRAASARVAERGFRLTTCLPLRLHQNTVSCTILQAFSITSMLFL